jgi:hypothetical protein
MHVRQDKLYVAQKILMRLRKEFVTIAIRAFDKKEHVISFCMSNRMRIDLELSSSCNCFGRLNGCTVCFMTHAGNQYPLLANK